MIIYESIRMTFQGRKDNAGRLITFWWRLLHGAERFNGRKKPITCNVYADNY